MVQLPNPIIVVSSNKKVTSQSNNSNILGTDVFEKIDYFDGLVLRQGNPVTVYSHLYCPCKIENQGSPLPTCINCGGSGHLFLQPRKTKMIMQSMGGNVNITTATEANTAGMAKITTYSDERLAYMDKVEIDTTEGEYEEVIYLTAINGRLKSFLIYAPLSVKFIKLFTNEGQLLQDLPNTDYSIIGNIITISEKYNVSAQLNKVAISIRYTHRPAYLIRELGRDVSQLSVSKSNRAELNKYAIGQLWHYFKVAEQNNQTL